MSNVNGWSERIVAPARTGPLAPPPVPLVAPPPVAEPVAPPAQDAREAKIDGVNRLLATAFGESPVPEARGIEVYQPGKDAVAPQPYAPSKGGGGIEVYQPGQDAVAPQPYAPSKGGGGIEVYQPGKDAVAPQPYAPSKGGGGIEVYQPGKDAVAPQPYAPSKGGGGIEVYTPGKDPKVNPAPTPDPAPVPTPTPSSDADAAALKAAKLTAVREALNPDGQRALDTLGAKLDDAALVGGKTLLDVLQELAGKQVDAPLRLEGLTTKLLLSELVQQLADPGLIHQSNKGTCAATTVEYYMDINHPAEYARLAGALFAGGSTYMAGGMQFRRDDTSIPRTNGDTRSNLDRLFQTATMDLSVLGDYDNRTDLHTSGDAGMVQEDVTDILNAAAGGVDGTFATLSPQDTPLATILSRMSARLAQGVEVPVGMFWSPGGRDYGHELLVTKIEGDRIFLRNPWGADEQGQAYGPNRALVDAAGNISMNLTDFGNRLIQVTV